MAEELYTKEMVEEENYEDLPVERLSDSAFYRMYLNEVKKKDIASPDKLQSLYSDLVAGKDGAANQIVDSWLMRVIEMSKFYKATEVNMEDVIQEGNMGLWMALSVLPADLAADKVDEYLTMEVKTAMENYIREITGNTDQTQAIIAKTALLYEAQNVLAEENGTEPSIRALSDYTHIPPEEIEQIFTLYKED